MPDGTSQYDPCCLLTGDHRPTPDDYDCDSLLDNPDPEPDTDCFEAMAELDGGAGGPDQEQDQGDGQEDGGGGGGGPVVDSSNCYYCRDRVTRANNNDSCANDGGNLQQDGVEDTIDGANIDTNDDGSLPAQLSVAEPDQECPAGSVNGSVDEGAAEGDGLATGDGENGGGYEVEMPDSEEMMIPYTDQHPRCANCEANARETRPCVIGHLKAVGKCFSFFFPVMCLLLNGACVIPGSNLQHCIMLNNHHHHHHIQVQINNTHTNIATPTIIYLLESTQAILGAATKVYSGILHKNILLVFPQFSTLLIQLFL